MSKLLIKKWREYKEYRLKSYQEKLVQFKGSMKTFEKEITPMLEARGLSSLDIMHRRVETERSSYPKLEEPTLENFMEWLINNE